MVPDTTKDRTITNDEEMFSKDTLFPQLEPYTNRSDRCCNAKIILKLSTIHKFSLFTDLSLQSPKALLVSLIADNELTTEELVVQHLVAAALPEEEELKKLNVPEPVTQVVPVALPEKEESKKIALGGVVVKERVAKKEDDKAKKNIEKSKKKESKKVALGGVAVKERVAKKEDDKAKKNIEKSKKKGSKKVALGGVVVEQVVAPEEIIQENRRKLKERVAKKLDDKAKKNIHKWKNTKKGRKHEAELATVNNLSNQMKGIGMM